MIEPEPIPAREGEGPAGLPEPEPEDPREKCYLCGWKELDAYSRVKVVVIDNKPTVYDTKEVYSLICSRCNAVLYFHDKGPNPWYTGSTDWLKWDEEKQALVPKVERGKSQHKIDLDAINPELLQEILKKLSEKSDSTL